MVKAVSYSSPRVSRSHPPAPAAAPLQALHTYVFDVQGMKCAGCVRSVERQLTNSEGVVSATVNLVTEVALVETSADQTVDPKALADRLTQVGFPTQLRGTAASGQVETGLLDWLARRQQEQRDQWGRLGVALGLLALSSLGHLKHLSGVSFPVLSDLWFHGILATVVLVLPAREILVDGWQGLRRGAPTMNTLVALGTLSAYTASVVAFLWPSLGWECFFDEPVMLLSFILLGRTLEQRARFRASDALRSLVALQPQTARLIALSENAASSSSGIQVPASVVQVGEWLQVLPGETIPADGRIEVGQTTVDESMVTGESLPMPKQPGETVVAGTLNQTGMIVLKVTNTGQDTVLAQMIQLVETAQTRKAPIQRLADSVSGYFTYGVLGLAIATFSFWYFVGFPLWPEAMHSALGPAHVHHEMTLQSSALLASLKRAIAVLVIACPCALGLATPTAILVGSGMGAERGLLIRGGDVLETLSRVDVVVFDKTGTLTQGTPQVTRCHVLDPASTERDVLTLVAAVEQGTQHPLAAAIQQAAQTQGLSLPPATDFYTDVGCGVGATVTWQGRPQRVRVGNAAWLGSQGISLPAADLEASDAQVSAAATVVYCALDQQLLGMLAVTDVLRPDAAETVAALQTQGRSVHLLSGDRQSVATAVATTVGIPLAQVTAEVRPADKVEQVRQLQSAGHCVALVGDGINDAPALAQADVGISLSSGTDIAAEAATVVLMGDRLTAIVEALSLGRATVAKIRQNLTWAFAYNLIGIPLAAGVLLPAYQFSLSPAIAGGLMALSSVTVVVNSLLLKAHRVRETASSSV